LRGLLASSILLCLTVSAGKAAEVPEVAESASILPIGEVHAGQRGHGISVFAGTEPQRFEVEIVGVLNNFAAGEDLILGRLTGQGLESTGVIAGMSGSPVWVEGRLVGAVALGWPFAQGALAGIRPIESMLRLSQASADGRVAGALPARRTVVSKAASGALLEALAKGEVSQQLLEPIVGRLRPREEMGGVPRLPWAMSGFGATSRAWFGGLLGASGQAAPAGSGSISAKGASPSFFRLTGGDAVAAVLVDGDLRMAATGTVTARDGGRVLAFGHPFLGNGPIEVPMAPAEIVTVMPSLYSSFKLSNLGPAVGAFEYDAQAGIVGEVGARARTIPLEIVVGARRYSMTLARLPEYLGILAASSFYGALDGEGYLQGEQGVSFTLDARLAGGRVLTLDQDFDGSDAPLSAVRFLLAALDYVATNPLEEVEIESLRLVVERAGASRQAFLVGARTDRPAVEPGETVRLDLEFKEARGAMTRRTIALQVPESAADGRLSLIVGDGATVDGLRLGLEPIGPVRFEQALEFLNRLHSRRELLVVSVRPARGVTQSGEALADLPGSIRSLWGASAQGGAAPLRFAVRELASQTLAAPFVGAVRIDLEVRAKTRSKALSEEG
jgi:hypothetical protein